jgi:hypothetical protein
MDTEGSAWDGTLFFWQVLTTTAPAMAEIEE